MGDERGSLLQRHLLLVQALCDHRTSKGDCQVLAVIAEHVGKEGEAWPGVNRIAGKAGIHRATVLRSVERLEQWGYVETQRERGRSNLYRLALASSTHATSASSTDATSASSTDATSAAGRPVASTHITSSTGATTPVASTLLDQSHPRDPNSALELSSSNSEKRTRLPAAPSFLDDQEPEQEQQRLQAEEQARLAKEEEQAKQRESLKAEYLETLATQPKRGEWMRRTWPFLADVAVDKAA